MCVEKGWLHGLTKKCRRKKALPLLAVLWLQQTTAPAVFWLNLQHITHVLQCPKKCLVLTALHNQLKLVVGAWSNCFPYASHNALHAYVRHKKILPMWSESTLTNLCMINSLFADASEPAISFSRYCNCLLAAFTFRMPSTYCASADARRSVSFVASTAYPSTDSPSCSLFRFAARYTDCDMTLILRQRFRQSGHQTDVQWECSHLTSSLRSLPTVCL